jgi:hypothetical protein
MNCPFCAEQAQIRPLHAHLVAEHGDRVRTEEAGERIVYVVTCPHCAAQYRKPIKKADPQFLAEFAETIRLVAFDMLLNHILAEHEQ